jgi:hypothetical protein
VVPRALQEQEQPVRPGGSKGERERACGREKRQERQRRQRRQERQRRSRRGRGGREDGEDGEDGEEKRRQSPVGTVAVASKICTAGCTRS